MEDVACAGATSDPHAVASTTGASTNTATSSARSAVTIQCLFEVTPMQPLTTTIQRINVRIVAAGLCVLGGSFESRR